jgi:hypothetical protein
LTGGCRESQPRLLDQMRAILRRTPRSCRPDKADIGWVKRLMLLHAKRPPKDLGAAEIRALLASLATQEPVAASPQHGARTALRFLYRAVLQQPCPHLADMERATRPRRLPTVFPRAAVHALLPRRTAMPHVLAGLLSGAGRRLLACVR